MERYPVRRERPTRFWGNINLFLAISAVTFAISVHLYSIDAIYPYYPKYAPPLEGPLKPNDRLQQCEIIAQGNLVGPEALAIDENGLIYASTKDGTISLSNGTVITRTGGRPLGLEFDSKGNLIIADAVKGLLELDISTRDLKILSRAATVTVNDVAISKEGKIYFTDSTVIPSRMENFSIFNTREASVQTVVTSNPYGRVLVYDPKTKETEILMDKMIYSNGVALSDNHDFLLIAETGTYQIHRYWLSGPKVHQREILVDNLPCVPDGIDKSKNNRFWISCFTKRAKFLDWIHPIPVLKKIMMHLPLSLRPPIEKYGMIILIDENGNFVESWHDQTGKINSVSSVVEKDDFVYVGTLTENFIVKCRL